MRNMRVRDKEDIPQVPKSDLTRAPTYLKTVSNSTNEVTFKSELP